MLIAHTRSQTEIHIVVHRAFISLRSLGTSGGQIILCAYCAAAAPFLTMSLSLPTPSSASFAIGSVDSDDDKATDRSKAQSGATTATPKYPSSSNSANAATTENDNDNDALLLDFIASGRAVKKLFALPYAATAETISVAVHNLDGTLLIDNDVGDDDGNEHTLNSKSSGNINPTKSLDGGPMTSASPALPMEKVQAEAEQSLVPLSTIESSEQHGVLALLKSILASSSTPESDTHTPPTNKAKASKTSNTSGTLLEAVPQTPAVVPSTAIVGDNDHQINPQQQHQRLLQVPNPEEYVQSHIPRPIPPREYLFYQCRDYRLLVGSDALVYRSGTHPDVTVRLENAARLHAALQKHQEAVRRGQFWPDYQRAALQQQGKPSYAQAASTQSDGANGPLKMLGQASNVNGFAAPDLDRVKLQTCIVPSTPMGGLLDPSKVGGPAPTKESTTSPVSIVVDAYLDNIMANVPQLALCLQEKGLIQSVKLLQTPDIPSIFLSASTIDPSRPFEILTPSNDTDETNRVFSPQIMEMNASALLSFLKTNCTRNNTTYLLRREAGESNIQLYDVSSISAQKQKQWTWWLAMMSYRFANRLRDLAHRGTATPGDGLARACRRRQRSLLENTLELLEVLSDLDDNPRESLVAAIREQLADTFLWDESSTVGPDASSPPPLSTQPSIFSQRQPYQNSSVDALEKAQVHLEKGVKHLWPVIQENLDRQKKQKERRKHRKKSSSSRIKVTTEQEDASSDSEEEKEDNFSDQNVAIATQLYGMHQKLVNVYLRLGEIHLMTYFTSSAMRCLRSAARRLADSLFLVGETLRSDKTNPRTNLWLHRTQLQYVWLWEHCGHFARSFGSDSRWRDRGHARADDVLSVLQDADAAFKESDSLMELQKVNKCYAFLGPDSLFDETGGDINLYHLSGVVSSPPKDSILACKEWKASSVDAARDYLTDQHLLRREERQVFVASCIAYQRAISAFGGLVDESMTEETSCLMGLLQQRLGDACNNVGMTLMNGIHGASTSNKAAVDPLLSSSLFWFQKGLEAFQNCGDLRNQALLRCNISQCYKLQANDIFAENSKDTFVHAENCLQEAVKGLLAAHTALGMRETDPGCWDMVSGELAATYLLLGVKRRQALIGTGNVPLILEQLRLSPGKERSIVEPMQKAMEAYEQMGNKHQAAAAHYQLALYYSKVWTCQRDENKAREKLAAAFVHFKSAHGYFTRAVKGNEIFLCTLCLDLANFYASIHGQGMVSKEALLCCFDTVPAFSPESVQAHCLDDEWLAQMASLASQVEDVVFKVLRSLTKLEEGSASAQFKALYRSGLSAKMRASRSTPTGRNKDEEQIKTWYQVLEAVRQAWDETVS